MQRTDVTVTYSLVVEHGITLNIAFPLGSAGLLRNVRTNTVRSALVARLFEKTVLEPQESVCWAPEDHNSATMYDKDSNHDNHPVVNN